MVSHEVVIAAALSLALRILCILPIDSKDVAIGAGTEVFSVSLLMFS